MIERIFTFDQRTTQNMRYLGEKFFASGQVPGKFNFDHMMSILDPQLRMGIGALWLMYTEGNDPDVVGALFGVLFPEVFTGDVIAIESFWFVDPLHRGKRDGIRLLEEFEEWARRSGAVRTHLAMMEALHPDKMAEFYLRRGYRKLETVYVR